VGATNRPSYCCSRSSMTSVEIEAKVAGAADVDVADRSTRRSLHMNARVQPRKSQRTGPRDSSHCMLSTISKDPNARS
jgi:hypothetical protein